MDYLLHFLRRLESEIPGEKFYINSSAQIVLARTGKSLAMEWSADDVDQSNPLEPLNTADFENILIETIKEAVRRHG